MQRSLVIRFAANHLANGSISYWRLHDWLGVPYMVGPAKCKLSEQDTKSILTLASLYYTGSLDSIRLDLIKVAIEKSAQPAQLPATIFNIGLSLVMQGQPKYLKAEAMLLLDVVPPDVMSRLELSLASLQSSLLADDPKMPTHLASIHQLLLSYPESVQLLDNSEIASIIGGLQKHTNTVIVAETAKKAAKGRVKTTVDDL